MIGSLHTVTLSFLTLIMIPAELNNCARGSVGFVNRHLSHTSVSLFDFTWASSLGIEKRSPICPMFSQSANNLISTLQNLDSFSGSLDSMYMNWNLWNGSTFKKKKKRKGRMEGSLCMTAHPKCKISDFRDKCKHFINAQPVFYHFTTFDSLKKLFFSILNQQISWFYLCSNTRLPPTP